MLRDELPVVEGRTLSDGVVSTGVRMLRDELPVMDRWLGTVRWRCKCWSEDAAR